MGRALAVVGDWALWCARKAISTVAPAGGDSTYCIRAAGHVVYRGAERLPALPSPHDKPRARATGPACLLL